MSAQYRDSSTAYFSNGAASGNITLPSTTQAGDLLLMFIGSSGSTDGVTVTGWTKFAPDGAFRTNGLYKWATAGDAGSVVSVTGLNAANQAVVAVYSNALNPFFDVSGVRYDQASDLTNRQASLTTGSVTTTLDDQLTVEFASARDVNDAYAGIGAYPSTLRRSVSGSYVAAVLCDQNEPIAGSSTSRSFSSLGDVLEVLTVAIIGKSAPNPPSITSPLSNATVDPRVPNTVSWDYSDQDSDPQSFAEIVARVPTSVFSYAGSNQSYLVPSGVSALEVLCYGAEGGGMVNGSGTLGAGGKGGYARSIIPVTPGESLTVIAGGKGAQGVGNGSSSPGGFGGGGPGGTTLNSTNFSGGSGGGRSAILRGATQLVVAGGGGGTALSAGGTTFNYGGDGGGLVGSKGGGAYAGFGGTATAGGSGGDGPSDLTGTLDQGTVGSSGQGGAGANAYPNANYSYGAGGGGGGYFGGGGGGISGTSGNSGSGYGGGGGSSYIVGAGETIPGVNSGDGRVELRPAHIVTGTGTSVQIPANEMQDESSCEIYVAVSDGTFHNHSSVNILVDSWTYGPEVTSSAQTGNLDTTGFSGGDYEVQVRTADQEYFGVWSFSASLTIIISNVMVYLAGSWTASQRKIRQGGTWQDHNPQKLP